MSLSLLKLHITGIFTFSRNIIYYDFIHFYISKRKYDICYWKWQYETPMCTSLLYVCLFFLTEIPVTTDSKQIVFSAMVWNFNECFWKFGFITILYDYFIYKPFEFFVLFFFLLNFILIVRFQTLRFVFPFPSRASLEVKTVQVFLFVKLFFYFYQCRTLSRQERSQYSGYAECFTYHLWLFCCFIFSNFWSSDHFFQPQSIFICKWSVFCLVIRSNFGGEKMFAHTHIEILIGLC